MTENKKDDRTAVTLTVKSQNNLISVIDLRNEIRKALTQARNEGIEYEKGKVKGLIDQVTTVCIMLKKTSEFEFSGIEDLRKKLATYKKETNG